MFIWGDRQSTGKFRESSYSTRRSAADAPNTVEAQRLLLPAYVQTGRLDEAKLLAGGLAPRYPGDAWWFWGLLGDGYFRAGKLHEAASAYELAIAARPGEGTIMNNLAYVLGESGKNLERAMTLAEKSVQEDPNSAERQDTLGFVLAKLGRLREAREALDRAVELLVDEPNSTIIEHLGDVYAQLGLEEEARGHLAAGART